ncbi:Glycoside hydrolase family 76 protein [Mycena kentingensis (nom. inval.)]|nr:Glycoside hydrolase family 76 protein [Mycena kentingensis (nom. inval.)]
MHLAPCSYLLSFLTLAAAYQAPSGWNVSIKTTPAERIASAEAALQESISRIDSNTGLMTDGASYWTTSQVFTQLVELDTPVSRSTDRCWWITSEESGITWLGRVLRTLRRRRYVHYSGVVALGLILVQVDAGLAYGIAAALAYNYYKTPAFLDYAVQPWWVARTFTISEDTSKSIADKNFTVASSCDGASMVGGTFHIQDNSTQTGINSLATADFMMSVPLSALLAESTSDSKYTSAAEASARFMHAHMIDPQGILSDTISGSAAEKCAREGPAANTANTGLYLFGLAVVWSVTKTRDFADWAGETAKAALSSRMWQGSNFNRQRQGSTPRTGDVYLPRALSSILARNAASSETLAAIRAYLAVQYNAVSTTARVDSTSSIYGYSWVARPASATYDATAQYNAVEVLIAAVSLEQDGSNSPPSSSLPAPSASTSPGGGSDKKNNEVATLVGEIGGAVAVTCLIVGVLLWLRRRQRAPARASEPDAFPDKSAVTNTYMRTARPGDPGPLKQLQLQLPSSGEQEPVQRGGKGSGRDFIGTGDAELGSPTGTSTSTAASATTTTAPSLAHTHLRPITGKERVLSWHVDNSAASAADTSVPGPGASTPVDTSSSSSISGRGTEAATTSPVTHATTEDLVRALYHRIGEGQPPAYGV